jgi:hypothetical protein
MRWHKFPKSPVLPAGKKWELKKRDSGYESEVTALVREMLEDPAIRDDQALAWERWRNESGSQSKP